MLSNQPDPQWLSVFDDIAAFRDRVFAKVGNRPHAHAEKVNWAKFDCAECIDWQTRFDGVFKEESRKNSEIAEALNGLPSQTKADFGY